jgi:hypothetical protein
MSMATNHLHVQHRSGEKPACPGLATRLVIIVGTGNEAFAQFDSQKVSIIAIMEALVHGIVGRCTEYAECVKRRPFAVHSFTFKESRAENSN